MNGVYSGGAFVTVGELLPFRSDRSGGTSTVHGLRLGSGSSISKVTVGIASERNERNISSGLPVEESP